MTPTGFEPLLELVTKQVNAYPDDIDKAADAVIAKAKRLTSWNKWTSTLIRKGVLQLVHDCRHGLNVKMRNAAGDYGGPAQVMPGEATGRILSSVYGYLIAGKSLGAVTGSELPEIAKSEAAKANGHQFNARLCRELAKHVKPEKTVRECVSEAKLRALFEKI